MKLTSYDTIADEKTYLNLSTEEGVKDARKRCNIWNVLNGMVWVFALCALVWIFKEHVPTAFPVVEMALGQTTGSTVLHTHRMHWPTPEEFEANTEPRMHYLYDNWSGYRFRKFATTPESDVPAWDDNMVSQTISAEMNGQVLNGIQIVSVDVVRHQAMAQISSVSEFVLLDCHLCQLQPSTNCECELLEAIPFSEENLVGNQQDASEDVNVYHINEMNSFTNFYHIQTGANVDTHNDGDIRMCEQQTRDSCAPIEEGPDAGERLVSRCCNYFNRADCPTDWSEDRICVDMSTCHLWDSWVCVECLGGTNVVETPEGPKFIDDLELFDYIQTGQSKNGEPIYSEVIYLVHKKNDVTHFRIEVSGGGFSIMTHNHLVETQRGEIGGGSVTEDDFLKSKDGKFEKVVSISSVKANTYSVRTTDPSGTILTNGVWVTENSLPGDAKYWRQVYNFFVFKILCRIRIIPYIVHHVKDFSLVCHICTLLLPIGTLSYFLRKKALKID